MTAAAPPELHRQRGVTLVELLIVILIGGVLAAIAAPSLQSVMRTMRQKSAVGLLMNDMNMARGEAIKRNARMLVCPRNEDDKDCGDDWSSGWLVCVAKAAPDNAECRVPASGEPASVVVVRAALDTSLTLGFVDEDGAGVTLVPFSANSTQSSGKEVTLSVGGTWTDAATLNVKVERTGSIARK